mmetsp:Transcript_13405/g.34141  ORF Transcript_13405/g.34141 Transcript_13405/m.34141 type:complete len:200 (+) Transcript_13405:930-1529(+)
MTDRSGAQPPEDHQSRHESKGRNPCGQAASEALNLSPSGGFRHRPSPRARVQRAPGVLRVRMGGKLAWMRKCIRGSSRPNAVAAPRAFAQVPRAVPRARGNSSSADVDRRDRCRQPLQLIRAVLVKALDLLDHAARDEPHLLGDPADKVLVVGDKDDAALEALHAVGKSRHRLEVEVVRRLVQHKHMRFDVRDGREGDS